MHFAEPNQTWYFKVRVKNSYGRVTSWSTQKSASTTKIDDASTWFSNAAIGDAQIGTLSLDRGWVGTLSGNYINAKNLSVADGNGKTTFSVNSAGNVSIAPATFELKTNNLTLSSSNEIFKMTHDDGSYTKISPGGLELYRSNSHYKYKCLIATGYFSIKGKGSAIITLPAQFDDVKDYEIELFYTIETSWASDSSMVDKTCICDMYVNDIYSTFMQKDSNGHWTQKVDYCLKDMCVVPGVTMNVGDVGNMSGYVNWIAFA